MRNNFSRTSGRLIWLLFLLCSISVRAQITSPGLVQVEIIKIPGVTTDNQLYVLTSQEKQTIRQYYDGLGRLIQTVNKEASPTGKDIILHKSYNALGQELVKNLPFTGTDGSGSFRSDASTLQTSFYANGLSDKVIDDSKPYSKLDLEKSSLERILYIGMEGDQFQPVTSDPTQHYKSVNYRSNSNTTYDAYNSGIRIWNMDGTSAGVYASGSLSVSELTNESGNITLFYKDANNRLVLKRQLITPQQIDGYTESCLDTYYVYDDAGDLVVIVPPKAVAAMNHNGSSWSISLGAVVELVYQFKYDALGRLIQKKVPSRNWINVVYDPMNRPVLVQDGNLAQSYKWNYYKYDSKGRVVSQGIYTDAVNTSQASMQTYVNGLEASYDTYYYEDRNTGTSPVFYTNRVFPTLNKDGSALQALVYTYYDDYDFNGDGNADYAYQSQGLSNEATATALTRGMVTGVYKKTLNNQGTLNVWLLEVMFYDKRGNTIQVLSSNHTNSASVSDRSTYVPDFTGKMQQSKIVKTVNSVTTTVLLTYAYDHVNRVTSIDQKNNTGNTIRVAAYKYNELGQLVTKQLHSTDNIVFMQNVDLRYNIRGALTSINNSTLSVDNINYTNSDANDLFGEDILYEKTDAAIGNAAYFDGNISAVKWGSQVMSNNNQRSYTFTYDKLNQLTNAYYKDRPYQSTGAWGNVGINDEKSITYDLNGNIKGLVRHFNNAASQIDNLTYSYNGNRLDNVSDNGGTPSGFNGTNASPYAYDQNGNLTSDPKKGVTISYNILNKTDKILFSNNNYIRYSYDASGELIRKETFVNSTSTTNTYDYIDGFVYEASTLSYFSTAEGRVRHSAGSFTYEYFIRDHLGNVRVSFDGTGGTAVARQENSYYPFGMTLPGNYVPTAANKNLYNAGSEWQNDFGNLPDLYQTYFRNYDAVLGRFIAVDILAELFDDITPYQFGYNNPISFNDPIGDMAQPSQSVFQILQNEFKSPYIDSDFYDKMAAQNQNDALFISGSGFTGGGGDSQTSGGCCGFWNGKGGLYKGLDWFNRNLNPVGVIVHGANKAIFAKDFLTKKPASRLEGVAEVGSGVFTLFGAGVLKFSKFGVLEQPLFIPQTSLTVNRAVVTQATEELSALNPTHFITKSKTQMQNLVNDIRLNGITESIKYVVHNGKKYIVDGHHRFFAAQKLGLQNVPVQEVSLPYSGYKTTVDLILEGQMPGFWKYIK